jgi:hypothetical protein
MRRSAALLRAVVVGSLVAGLALMIPFEATITRLLGVALLVAFIIGALFLIAEPKFLEGDRD